MKTLPAFALLFFLLPSLSLAATFTVTNSNDAGAGSFRQAITSANATPGADIIAFAIGGGAYTKINLTTILPNITDQVRIDGWSQGGPGYNSSPLIEISGVGLTNRNIGLNVTAALCEIRGMIINGFLTGIQCSNKNTWIYGNYIGTDNTGGMIVPNKYGISLLNTTGVFIGTNSDGTNDAAEKNLISGDTVGVYISQGGKHGIFGNLIGTDITGMTPLGNVSYGILISNSSENTIGDAAVSARNIISGNNGYGIYITASGGGAKNNWVKGNYIGIDLTGEGSLGNQYAGVFITSGASYNVIGSNGDGISDALERNVVSCNYPGTSASASATNISINGTNTSNNTVAGNYLGLTASGQAFPAAVNPGVRGVQIASSANNNIVGGTTPETRNVVGGHAHFGIEMAYNVTGTRVMGNYIGTDPTGTVAIPNISGGIQIYSNCTGNIIGTDGDGSRDALEGNLVSGNGRGIRPIYGADNNIIAGNLIGTDPTGMLALPNSQSGIEVYNCNGTIIGGSLPAQRNIISGNKLYGITIYGTSSGSVVYNNYVGTDIAGTAALGNGWAGIEIGCASNVIGSGMAGTGNLISGNKADGILFQGSTSASNKVQGNYIGTDATGTLNLGNVSYGIRFITSANGNTIGTNADGVNDAGERNLISGNCWNNGSISSSAANIRIEGTGSDNNLITGNYIGTDYTGKALIPNAGIRGIQLAGGTGTVIGGISAVTRNVICGQKHYGIELVSISGIKITGNYIGVDAAGTSALGNTNGGIQLYTNCSSNVIGTNSDGINDSKEGNVISGNGTGITFFINCSSNIIAGNFLGTDFMGISAIPNNVGIVIFNSGQNMIGDITSEARNVVSGNKFQGIVIGGNSSSNFVYNNYIGVQRDGSSALKNGGDGILVQNPAGSNVLGGTGSMQANVIAFNGGNGVNIVGDIGNTIRGNSIYSNTKLGIDLSSNMVTLNDPGDVDEGPNGLQNFPTVLKVTGGASSTIVDAVLHSIPSTTYVVDFYDNTVLNPTGYGEGRTYLGSATVTTDANGFVAFTQTFPAGSFAGLITLTATDPSGSTSEFSGPFGDPLPVTFVSFDVKQGQEGVNLKWVVTAERNVSHYEVQSSLDGINFTLTATLDASGISRTTYAYSDIRNLNGEVFYRVIAVDRDGARTISPIRAITVLSEQDAALSVYPNPARSKVHISLPECAVLKVTEVNGTVVFEKAYPAGTQNITESLDLPAGIYAVSAISETGIQVRKLVVE